VWEIVENPPSSFSDCVWRGGSLLGAVPHIPGQEGWFFPKPESHLKGDFQEQTPQGRASYTAASYLIDASY